MKQILYQQIFKFDFWMGKDRRVKKLNDLGKLNVKKN
jgi:hypothetical protein